MKIMELTVKEYNKIMKDGRLKFGDNVILTKTNCGGVQGFIFKNEGIEEVEDINIKKMDLSGLGYESNLTNRQARQNIVHNFRVMGTKINELVESVNKLNKELNDLKKEGR